MRLGPFAAMIVLLLGAVPASAGEYAPADVPAGKPAVKHVRKAARHVAPEPAESKPVEAKPVEAKPVEAKPVETKPAETKPLAPKAIETKPAEAKPAPKDVAAKTPEPSQDAFTGIPPSERLKVQAALSWSGDYPGAGNGDDPMLTAIRNFQKRNKGKITGVLSPAERASLVAAADAHEKDFGWSMVVDPATGIRIGLPTKMVPIARDAARGTRWSSAHGEVQVETFRFADPDLKLAALFEQQKKEPANRRVEYSALRDDGFIISGLQGLKMYTVRATMRGGEVRGFTLYYDQMMETIVAPVMVAMASAFSPFPERSAPFAAMAKSVEYGNGLVVSAQGHIITDRKLTEGCQVIVASGLGDAVRIAEDVDNGLALLRVYGPRKFSALVFPQDAPKVADLTLIGIPDPKEQGNRKLTEIKARLVGGAAIELRQPVPMAGFSGAAALDTQGRFLGMLELRNAVLASADVAVPPVRLVTAEAIGKFLAAQNIATEPAQAADAKPADAKASVVRMICVRK